MSASAQPEQQRTFQPRPRVQLQAKRALPTPKGKGGQLTKSELLKRINDMGFNRLDKTRSYFYPSEILRADCNLALCSPDPMGSKYLCQYIQRHNFDESCPIVKIERDGRLYLDQFTAFVKHLRGIYSLHYEPKTQIHKLESLTKTLELHYGLAPLPFQTDCYVRGTRIMCSLTPILKLSYVHYDHTAGPHTVEIFKKYERAMMKKLSKKTIKRVKDVIADSAYSHVELLAFFRDRFDHLIE